jgi:hypothetical protein
VGRRLPFSPLAKAASLAQLCLLPPPARAPAPRPDHGRSSAPHGRHAPLTGGTWSSVAPASKRAYLQSHLGRSASPCLPLFSFTPPQQPERFFCSPLRGRRSVVAAAKLSRAILLSPELHKLSHEPRLNITHLSALLLHQGEGWNGHAWHVGARRSSPESAAVPTYLLRPSFLFLARSRSPSPPRSSFALPRTHRGLARPADGKQHRRARHERRRGRLPSRFPRLSQLQPWARRPNPSRAVSPVFVPFG